MDVSSLSQGWGNHYCPACGNSGKGEQQTESKSAASSNSLSGKELSAEEMKRYTQQELDFMTPSNADRAAMAMEQALNANAVQIGGSHYKDAQVQPWNVVDTWPMEQRVGFYRGNALKYIMRMGTKDENVQEIKKAVHYLQKLIDTGGFCVFLLLDCGFIIHRIFFFK